MKLTVAYISSRSEPALHWFLESLNTQLRSDDEIKMIVVSPLVPADSAFPAYQRLQLSFTKPKPTVWQGEHRLTMENWWAASNARNTGICLCKTDWICFCDDRCVLMPGWLEAIRRAMDGNYAVFGSYEKRTGMTVENGVIQHGGIIVGEDSRHQYVTNNRVTTPYKCPGEWAFGCNLALPLEWALQVNGYEELCDGLGMEDVVFGKHLANSGFDLRFDPGMKIVEDRTPEFCDPVMKKTSKRKFDRDPDAKDFKALALFMPQKGTLHQWNLRGVRHTVLNGGQWPVPTQPETDWFDGQKLSDM